MTPRGLLTTVGATALGIGIVVGGAAGMPSARAQDATPSAQAPARAQQANDFEAQRDQAYKDFVAALANELGDDQAAVDAAIRTALKQEVDKRQTAGDLSVEQAAAMKAVIDVSQAPLFSGFGGHGGPHGFDGRGNFEDHGPRGGRGEEWGKNPGGAPLPPAQPDDEEGADQSAPASFVPAPGTAII
jgi:hypothetical protein